MSEEVTKDCLLASVQVAERMVNVELDFGLRVDFIETANADDDRLKNARHLVVLVDKPAVEQKHEPHGQVYYK